MTSADEPNRRKLVYNLEFPSWCPEITVFGYRFTRMEDYEDRVKNLQHLVEVHAEFSIPANSGGNVITAYVSIPNDEEKAVLEWADNDATALSDILLLLSIFSGRDVFVIDVNGDDSTAGVITADPRIYEWGGVLRTSIPYKSQPIRPASLDIEMYKLTEDGEREPIDVNFLYPYSYDVGFQDGLDEVYGLIRTEEWQSRYRKGYFLFLARQAFRRQSLESAFIQCWATWEHLFAVLNGRWLSKDAIHQLSSHEKIAFLLVQYALKEEVDNTTKDRIKSLVEIRNRLIHFGRFPERGSVHDDAILFIRLTEFIIAKILGLSPSNIFNTIEHLEKFLRNAPSK